MFLNIIKSILLTDTNSCVHVLGEANQLRKKNTRISLHSQKSTDIHNVIGDNNVKIGKEKCTRKTRVLLTKEKNKEGDYRSISLMNIGLSSVTHFKNRIQEFSNLGKAL